MRRGSAFGHLSQSVCAFTYGAIWLDKLLACTFVTNFIHNEDSCFRVPLLPSKQLRPVNAGGIPKRRIVLLVSCQRSSLQICLSLP
jgi:hypothetical protein